MIIVPQRFADVFVIETEKNSDERGSFTRFFCEREFLAGNINMPIKQINVCENKYRGTLRGMHLQKNQYAEKKVITCLSGAIYDVIVDMRKDSDTYLEHFEIELSDDNGKLLFVPEGFAHGYVSLTDNTKLLYLMSQFFQPDSATGYRYDDPKLNINWPIKENLIISDKDKNWAYL